MEYNLKKTFFFLTLFLFTFCEETPLIISFDSPAEIWEETLPLGNGRLGAMPYGGINEEKIILNEEIKIGYL